MPMMDQYGNVIEKSVVDGFTLSASTIYLPTTYRVSVLASMEALRKARGYRSRWFITPVDSDQPIGARSQLEYQIQTQPGSYVWGISFSAPFNDTGTEVDADFIYFQITDACTETPFFSDYAKASAFEFTQTSVIRAPFLMMPRLIGEPGLLNVEIYNGAADDINCQLLIMIAEPCLPTAEMDQMLKRKGL